MILTLRRFEPPSVFWLGYTHLLFVPRLTCTSTFSQLHASCQEIFLNEFLADADFILCPDDLYVISSLPDDFRGVPKTIFIRIQDPPIPSDQIPSASSVARAVNRFANLEGLSFSNFSQAPPVGQAYLRKFFNDLTLINLKRVIFTSVKVADDDLVALIKAQPHLNDLDFEDVDISGTWDEVFAAGVNLPIRRFEWTNGKEEGDLIWMVEDGEAPPQVRVCDDDGNERLETSKLIDGYSWSFRSQSQAETQEYLRLFITLYRLQRYRHRHFSQTADTE